MKQETEERFYITHSMPKQGVKIYESINGEATPIFEFPKQAKEKEIIKAVKQLNEKLYPHALRWIVANTKSGTEYHDNAMAKFKALGYIY